MGGCATTDYKEEAEDDERQYQSDGISDGDEMSAADAMARMAPAGAGGSSSGFAHGTAETHGTGEALGDDDNARTPAGQVILIDANQDESSEALSFEEARKLKAPGGSSPSSSGFAHGTAESGTAERRSMVSFS